MTGPYRNDPDRNGRDGNDPHANGRDGNSPYANGPYRNGPDGNHPVVNGPVVLASRDRLPLHRRALPLLAVGVAAVLAKTRPSSIRSVLQLARRGARPATAAQALCARRAVVAVSLRCAGQACLQRSIAVALLCRAYGAWPTWCSGVRTHPFAAHAWIEAEGRLIGEPHPPGHYRPLITVPPH